MTESQAQDYSDAGSSREIDRNGYLLIKDNPITRAGVFQYKGSSLPDADPNKIYSIYRPLEELSNPEALESFRGLPIIDEHEMLGDRYERSPEERGTHGSILESIALKGNDVVANLRIWSRTMKNMIDAGKKGLSLGYSCKFEKIAGIFDGIHYDYIQKNIRGNHLALVTQGRSGTVVLDQHDAFDHFDLALDTKEKDMADENKDDKSKETKTEAKGGEGEMTLTEAVAMLKKIVPQVEALTAAMKTASSEEESETALDADTKEKEGDQKAEDKGDDKAMDAADVERIVGDKIGAFTKTGVKSIMGEVTKRDALAKDLTPHIGSFDCSAMDADDVAIYGVEKLGLKASKGQEQAVLSGFLAGAKKTAESKTGYAMDSAMNPKPKADGKLAKRLSGVAA